jgi:hypothetical protein
MTVYWFNGAQSNNSRQSYPWRKIDCVAKDDFGEEFGQEKLLP